MPRRVIVTASDSGYMPWLSDLISSIRDKPESAEVDVVVFDLGLSEEDVQWLAERNVSTRAPLMLFAGDTARMGGFWCRPLIPDALPEYDLFLWIDADAWVQDWSAVELFFAVAESGRFGVVQAYDRGYTRLPRISVRTLLGFPVGLKSWRWNRYWRAYGRRAATRLVLEHDVNNGVFSLARGAPHWAAWAAAYRKARFSRNVRGFDQFAFNYALQETGLRATYLPATCNWLCWRGLPHYDEDSDLLVEPQPPHETLGIIHLLHQRKQPVVELVTTAGGAVTRTLRYANGHGF